MERFLRIEQVLAVKRVYRHKCQGKLDRASLFSQTKGSLVARKILSKKNIYIIFNPFYKRQTSQQKLMYIFFKNVDVYCL